MIIQRLPEFNQVSANKTSILRIPKYNLTLKKLELRMGGTAFTKAQVGGIRVKFGTRVVWTVTQGVHLDLLNAYKGVFTELNHLAIDFSERDGKDIVAEEIGGLDLSKLNDECYLEVDILGATAPTLYALAQFTPPQGNSSDPKQLVQKLVTVGFNASLAGGRNQLPFNPAGALVKRASFIYTGTDWTTTADGNLFKVEVKKNGTVIWEYGCYDSRFAEQIYKKVPQSKMYVADFLIDNNASGALVTADAAALEWNLFVTAADAGIQAYFDVLDKPYNL